MKILKILKIKKSDSNNDADKCQKYIDCSYVAVTKLYVAMTIYLLNQINQKKSLLKNVWIRWLFLRKHEETFKKRSLHDKIKRKGFLSIG